MRSVIKNKRGGFTDLYIFMIFSFVIILFSVVFIYIGNRATDQLHETMDDMDLHDTEGHNASVVIDATMGQVNVTYTALYWITILVMGGMIVGIFIGSYLVTTKPVFFVPYIFMVAIAVVVGVVISNAYETLMTTDLLAGTFAGFVGANWVMLNLPIWLSIIGIGGGIIMFSRLGKREEQFVA